MKSFEMAGNKWFQFKQFRIIQEKAAMKVGTDAVLLGAWADAANAKNILDVGTGTGIIALMMAQRSVAQITAVEIEKQAAGEAAENAQHSPWSNRISVKNISFQDFTENTNQKYDCIVSNPPFFCNNIKSADKNLALARHNDLLSLTDLADGASKLLSDEGKLSLILPVESASKFIKLANQLKFHNIRQTEVRHTFENKAHRFLLEFSKSFSGLNKTALNIYNETGRDYTPEYKNLTRDFYLKF